MTTPPRDPKAETREARLKAALRANLDRLQAPELERQLAQFSRDVEALQQQAGAAQAIGA